ncbi:MAG: hypothetical protein NTW42_09355 [Deltaproteobacteria bacterium]|nr:hypothetical protein [Deltaproteobacteria bacterium]
MRFLGIVVVTMIATALVCPVFAGQTKQQVIPASVQAQLDDHIKQYISGYKAKNCDDLEPGIGYGSEYKEGRRFYWGDLDGDGTDDIAVLYAIEGLCCGNTGQHYLAVFVNKSSKFEIVTAKMVGGTGERGIRFNMIKNGKILLNTDEYLPDDPMCCPSGKGRTAYILQGGKLIESDRVGEKPIPPRERFRRALKQAEPLVRERIKTENMQ